MRIFEHYQKGINLGGWISQPLSYEKEHFDSFISEQDMKDIAEMGFDHVRLPIDYDVIQSEDETFIESGLKHIDDCIYWASKYHLHMILDLHKTAGYCFDKQETSGSFFTDKRLQERFFNIWDFLSSRYGRYEHMIAFEILNEIVDPNVAEQWNAIARRCIKTIRKNAPVIPILIGGVESNSVKSVKLLEPPIDENIVYNFHCYEPMIFTHQAAYWIKDMPKTLSISYPQTSDYLLAETRKIKALCPSPLFDIPAVGKSFFEELFRDAVEFAEQNNVPLYCGEFGVIALADKQDALAWFSDITETFQKYGIGYAMWNYKNKDFGLIDDYKSIKDALIMKII